MAFFVEKSREMVVSIESQKSVPTPFLIKTYQLVDDPSTDHIVSWGEEATSFVVWRPPEFARDILPNYFKHNNFSSFVRQLNTYGFRKIVIDRWEFANDFFIKGGKNLLSEIHRRKTSQASSQYNSPTPFHYHDEISSWIEPPILSLPNRDENTFISALSEDNERLRRKNSYLLSELANVKKLYNDIIYFIQSHVSPMPAEQSLMSTKPCRLVEIDPSDHQCSKSNAILDGSSKQSEVPNSTVKLFGVSLHGKKRLHWEIGGGKGCERE
ncbi:heat stress transcription factor B-4b-like [Dendrobium catenatum]|uniref:Heat stress transcription factor B-4b n=1 Tax=Dendrobium catenatum TaxID=906689 RepID=A0A2I0VHY0_9ASPA|nr:heat stress transcription factor B-4b-like [Dendrobium catenatum]PKU63022.1 Heat stress transcription factor B-4b [Dendrobium catenatum]